MRVLTKHVLIEGEDYMLFEDVSKTTGYRFFGTISYGDLEETEYGYKAKREMCNAEMCVSFKNVAEALERRKHEVEERHFIEENHLDLDNAEDCKKLIQFIDRR